jgi:hypothetical protein
MYFQFLIEDRSGSVLIESVMKKIKSQRPDINYSCKSFGGIGGFSKRNSVNEIKTGKLLNDLVIYLRGFNKSLRGIDAAIFIIIDNDKRNTDDFMKKLKNVADTNMITIDHVFCIAVEEIEAWLLGDEAALIKAYPAVKMSVLHSYEQDSICGTWEILADAIYPGGSAKLKKEYPTYTEIGICKSEWAGKIGEYLNISNNKSPSFQLFISEIQKRLSAA